MSTLLQLLSAGFASLAPVIPILCFGVSTTTISLVIRHWAKAKYLSRTMYGSVFVSIVSSIVVIHDFLIQHSTNTPCHCSPTWNCLVLLLNVILLRYTYIFIQHVKPIPGVAHTSCSEPS